MSESADKVVSEVLFQISQIEKLFAAYRELLERSLRESPNAVETAALGSVRHSFYNGLEGIFLVVAKEIDHRLPTGAHWHRDLLTQMTQRTERRGPAISEESFRALGDYMGFRHSFRHAYSFILDWEDLEKLIVRLQGTWARLKGELEGFASLRKPQSGTNQTQSVLIGKER